MPGEVNPARDGKYLREFEEDDYAFSWWRNGRWYTQAFFDMESDECCLPWRGGVEAKCEEIIRKAAAGVVT